MTNLSLWTYTAALNPDLLPDLDAREYEIAIAIARVTEEVREKESYKEELAGGTEMGLLGMRFNTAEWRGWDVIIQDFEVVKAIALSAEASMSEVVRVARDKCRPRHWRSLMWFSFNVELLDPQKATPNSDLIEAAKLAQRAIEARVRKENAASGGFARSQKYADAKRWVQDEWREGRDDYQGNKSAFAREYVDLVNKKFDLKVDARTITESWLRGIQ